MSIQYAEQHELQILEESLWLTKTRFDRHYMEKVLHADFFEFGRSGKIYSRADCLDVAPQEIHAKIPLENFVIHPIEANVRLITYISEVQYDTVQRANRSSLWVRFDDAWQLRFHQGTPI